MNNLLDQFNNIKVMPIFEIETTDGEFEIHTIEANEQGLSILYTDVTHEWDNIFSLDENLQMLFENLIEQVI